MRDAPESHPRTGVRRWQALAAPGPLRVAIASLARNLHLPQPAARWCAAARPRGRSGRSDRRWSQREAAVRDGALRRPLTAGLPGGARRRSTAARDSGSRRLPGDVRPGGARRCLMAVRDGALRRPLTAGQPGGARRQCRAVRARVRDPEMMAAAADRRPGSASRRPPRHHGSHRRGRFVDPACHDWVRVGYGRRSSTRWFQSAAGSAAVLSPPQRPAGRSSGYCRPPG